MDVLKPGQIGGNCLLHKARLDDNMQYIAPLQSWAPELRNFVDFNVRNLA
jgi:protein O-GlcNAc transferase